MRRALGKGLAQLIGEQADAVPSEAPVEAIVPNPRQPRRRFDADALRELAASIKVHGVLQPIVVRALPNGKYELIAGERRWRASKLAGLTHVPIHVKTADHQASLELALIENIQREDIGPIEAALAYRLLMEEFGMTQEQVAERVGKSRAAVANTVRLLRLPRRVIQALEEHAITEGHARPLLALDSQEEQLALLDRILNEGLSSKQVEQVVKRDPKPKRAKKTVVGPEDPNWQALQDRASEVLGSPVTLTGTERGGSIVIRFFSEDDLIRLMDQLGVTL